MAQHSTTNTMTGKPLIESDRVEGTSGEDEHAIPWSKLTYDTSLGGYRTDITEAQLRGAPSFSRDSDYNWSESSRERELHDYWRSRYYWE